MIKKILIKNKILIIFILILITFYRSPYILTEGRFLAEEGYIWYRNVFLNGQSLRTGSSQDYLLQPTGSILFYMNLEVNDIVQVVIF